MPTEIHTVTGAFGYTGRYIAKQLINAGYETHTLTNKPPRDNPFGNRITCCPKNPHVILNEAKRSEESAFY